MIIPEILLYVIAAFGVGSYVGLKKGEEVRPVQKAEKRLPEVWIPLDHQQMIRTCSLSCGDNSFKSYDAIRGKCECNNKGK